MKTSSHLDLDLQWLRRHPETNVRVRRAVEGEYQEILDKALPQAGEELAQTYGVMPQLVGSNAVWCVCVIRTGPNSVMRLLCIKDADALEKDPLTDNGCGIAVLIGSRVVVDKVRI